LTSEKWYPLGTPYHCVWVGGQIHRVIDDTDSEYTKKSHHINSSKSLA
jgi:hypothetical protein